MLANSILSIISIHAPSRERPTAKLDEELTKIFQSTLPRGSDGISVSTRMSSLIFQSTLPRGSDAFLPRRFWPHYHFNPRSLAGAT